MFNAHSAGKGGNMKKALLDIDFKQAVNELIGDYFYLFSGVYSAKHGVPTNKEMLSVVREELDCCFGGKVYLSPLQKEMFNKVFTREYNLIVNDR